jgi:NAD(P)-dependent dehydrogenase (short-subunit alcohol dehydrogenase family)
MINAGILGDESLTFEQRFLQVMKTNVVSVVAALRQLGELLRPDGVMAVMSSELGSIADNTKGGWEPYRSSKAALNQSLRSFIAEQLDVSWSLTAAAPGWVRTDIGGSNAPLDVETSTNGVVDMLETRFGKRGVAFMNYRGETLRW